MRNFTCDVFFVKSEDKDENLRLTRILFQKCYSCTQSFALLGRDVLTPYLISDKQKVGSDSFPLLFPHTLAQSNKPCLKMAY